MINSGAFKAILVLTIAGTILACGHDSTESESTSQTASVSDLKNPRKPIPSDYTENACSEYFFHSLNIKPSDQYRLLNAFAGKDTKASILRTENCRKCALKISGMSMAGDYTDSQRERFGFLLTSCQEYFSKADELLSTRKKNRVDAAAFVAVSGQIGL